MIDVLFFADLQEKVGSEKIRFQSAGMTVQQLKDKLIDSYKLENLTSAMVAVNEEYAQESTMLREGDTVAFIPPVSGG